MIDLRHPLAVLATRMPWAQLEASMAPLFAHRHREGVAAQGIDLFGATAQLAGAGVSAAGRPRLPIRPMLGLRYLKHAFHESDESVCERWAENVYFRKRPAKSPLGVNCRQSSGDGSPTMRQKRGGYCQVSG
ncbi:hypothetical protein WJ92_27545 [Burkholderia ubonensis]|nr:hypothetical protein WJ92_27545 [Burkholderia ubonensis]